MRVSFDAIDLMQLQRKSRRDGKLSLPDAASPKINLEKLQSKRNTHQRNEQQEQRDQKDLEN